MPAVYDPASAFSASSNTSGPWAYGYAATLSGTFVPGGAMDLSPEVDAWGAGDYLGVFHNPSSGDVSFSNTIYLHAGELGMHPGSQGQYAAVQFTAPANGYYQIDAHFASRDTSPGGTDAHVLVNGIMVFGSVITDATGVGMNTPTTVYLEAGDVVDFRVGYGPNGNYYYDSTNLAATITTVDAPPAPSTDAAGAFSPTANDNNGWSFGWSPTLNGSFVAGDAFVMGSGVAGWGNTSEPLDLPGAFKNLSNQSQTVLNTITLGAGELALHPGANGEYAVARYVVTTAGPYMVTGAFAGRDSSFGGTDAHVLINGVAVFEAMVIDNDGVGMNEPLVVDLNAGDTVDYRVGTGANNTYFNDTTALTAAVLSVDLFVVDTEDTDPNDGKTSLREAVAIANGNAAVGNDTQVITFDMTQVGPVIEIDDTITFKKGSNVYIVGPGASSLTIMRDADAGDFSLFTLLEGSNVIIAGLKFTDGQGDFGGAIDSSGNLTVTGCEILNNSSVSDGGGIAAVKGTLEIYDSSINGNNAQDRGGAVYVGRDVTRFRMNNSIVGLNSAKHGGGIYLNLVPDAIMNGIEVVGNIAKDDGGGIWCSGRVTLRGSTNIHNNIVTDANNGEGGGVLVDAGTINLIDIRIGFNQASKGDGMFLHKGVTRKPAAGGVTYEGEDSEVLEP